MSTGFKKGKKCATRGCPVKMTGADLPRHCPDHNDKNKARK